VRNSLHAVATRPAEVAETLVSTNFSTGTHGFASPGDPKVAVCLRPGTEILWWRAPSGRSGITFSSRSSSKSESTTAPPSRAVTGGMVSASPRVANCPIKRIMAPAQGVARRRCAHPSSALLFG
jgi:hypothetical protein